VGDLMRDADTCGPEHDGAIRREIFATCDI
jgi:hypothetical protein